MLQVCADHEVAGLIATNTTTARDVLSLRDAGLAGEAGGLSGRPLTERAREVVVFISASSAPSTAQSRPRDPNPGGESRASRVVPGRRLSDNRAAVRLSA